MPDRVGSRGRGGVIGPATGPDSSTRAVGAPTAGVALPFDVFCGRGSEAWSGRGGAAVGEGTVVPGVRWVNVTEPRFPVPDASSARSLSIASIAELSWSIRRAASERTPSLDVANRSGCSTCALRR